MQEALEDNNKKAFIDNSAEDMHSARPAFSVNITRSSPQKVTRKSVDEAKRQS